MNTRMRTLRRTIHKRRNKGVLDDDGLRRMDSTSSYMQQRRKIYVNTNPDTEYDAKGRPINAHYVSNRVRTAKYTPLTFIPKNLFEQFRNVANLYFLFLVILQCIPIFGVVEPAVSALPLIAILIITGIKDAIEDWKRNQSDQRVNKATTLTLANWQNVNIPDTSGSRGYYLRVICGFFAAMAGLENSYAQIYRAHKNRRKNRKLARKRQLKEDKYPLTQLRSSAGSMASIQKPKRAMNAQRSASLRSDMDNLFQPIPQTYRPSSMSHSTIYRTSTHESYALPRRSSTVHPSSESVAGTLSSVPTTADIDSGWERVQWQHINVGDYVLIRRDENVPADIAILSTSEDDNICYTETQNLDGETNLKLRQAISMTSSIRNAHDCEQAKFRVESEPPTVNLYQYNGVIKAASETLEDYASAHTGGSFDKMEPITYSNILLRGCVLRDTDWVIGLVLFTGVETKIMLNSGKTPSKRSKISKETNPHVIANFVILAIICIVSSIINSIQFHDTGSSRYFDYGLEGDNATYSGFLAFWVTLILYQNIVPISLYISVEIVKTLAAYFIYSDLDMYHAETDTPCIAKTWNISDDLGQIEYIFSDKTGTLTQNVMEYRKCTIHGVKYGLGMTEATLGAKKRELGRKSESDTGIKSDQDREMERLKKETYDKQRQLFDNPYIGENPTFADPKMYDDLARQDAQSASIEQFYLSLALCHTVVADLQEDEDGCRIDYRAQSPDEAALVATARDVGFVFLGRENNTLHVQAMGVRKSFELLNVIEFNSTRKRMSVIIRPHDSDRILLLCKGADSIIYERLGKNFGSQEELAKEQSKLRETTLEHLDEFASEGLRTLCLAYRFISPEEYKEWSKRFMEASASLYDREEKLAKVGEEIERDLLLMGGTAIEDRLQDGVPETIAELAKSGIKLWVLTGDKTETAINIGYACNLLTADMNPIVLSASNQQITTDLLRDALERTSDYETTTEKYAIVIDGTTLKYALKPETRQMMLELGTHCSSVICCRVSPKQKAQVVALIKKGLKVMTLAIGDGANDVSMIQEANVGVGISGLEGRQAVMASDYAIAQFRFLRKLLLVHGRWSYLRTSEMIMGFFYKNIVWTFVLFWYQIFCQFSGTMFFDYSLVTLYNLIFTSLPIIFLGIWDQDVSAKVSLKYPQMFLIGLRNDKFKTWRFWMTVLDSVFQSSVCFFFPYMLLVGGDIDPTGYDANGLYEFGTIVSSIAVWVANLFVAFALYSYTWIQVGIISLSILVYYLFVIIYAQFNTFTFAGHYRLFGTGLYWLMLILTIVACFIPRVAAKHYRHQYHPYDNDIVREIELVKNNGRRASNAEEGAINEFIGNPNDIKLQER